MLHVCRNWVRRLMVMSEFGLILAFLVIGGLWLCIDIDD